ncbi:uncharacterized protein LOC114515655 [Dendronephthya gigantea]|uniref:uncharacterized protein LOC114515655 n=1 Tax=Dendronephthya gigantea TaxID=151771 RepID=UPI00106D0819|nr:uncharacterized protein LOC114515655 [Dendronephthya gigantea]
MDLSINVRENLLLLQCFFLALSVCNAENCDGTVVSEKFTGAQPKYIQVMPGNQAILNWTWCVAENSSITGIIVYRVIHVDSQITNHALLSMGQSKKVYQYVKDNSRHELWSAENLIDFQEKAVFVINNVSKADGGEYSLHVRRLGYSDLHNEITLVVTSGGITKVLMAPSRKQITKWMSRNNSTDFQPSQRRPKTGNGHLNAYVFSSVVAFCFLIMLVVVPIVYCKWKRRGHQAICLRSRKRCLKSTSKSSGQDYYTLV